MAKISKDELSKIYGKIKFVDSFPDYKVKIVDNFADIHVKLIDSFPNSSGKWKVVESFPDYKIKIVDSFPDFTIKYVDSFPGVKQWNKKLGKKIILDSTASAKSELASKIDNKFCVEFKNYKINRVFCLINY